MPRNSSGTYSLPLPPVVPDTVIESAWANTTLNDLAQAMTNSLDRYGQGAMVAPLRFVDGTVGVPGIAWQAETGTGFYRESAGVMSVAVQGAKVAQWAATGMTIASGRKLTLLDAPTAATDAVNKAYADSAAGAYLPLTGGALSGSLSVAGDVQATGVVTSGPGTAGAPGIAVGNANTGLYSAGAGQLGLTTLGAPRLTVNGTGNVVINAASVGATLSVGGDAGVSGIVTVGAGFAASPTLAFAGFPTTGLYSDGSNAIGVSTAGLRRLSVNSVGNVVVYTPTSGTALSLNQAAAATGLTLAGSAGASGGLSTGQFALSTGGSTGRLITDSQGEIIAFSSSRNNGVMELSVGSTGGQVSGLVLRGGAAGSNPNTASIWTTSAERLSISNQGNVTINSPISGTALNLLGSMTLTGSITPNVTNAYNLGSPGNAWIDVSATRLRLISPAGFQFGSLLAGDGPQRTVLDSTGSGGLLLQTNSITRMTIAIGGDITCTGTLSAANIPGTQLAGDPGSAVGSIPIGSILGANSFGAAQTLAALGTLALNASNYLAIYANTIPTNIQYGTWRKLGEVSNTFGVWMRIA